MNHHKNLIGLKFGRLTVVSLAYVTSKYQRYYNCACDCGNMKVVGSYTMISKRSRSCGCVRKEVLKTRGKKNKLIAYADNTVLLPLGFGGTLCTK